MTRQRALILEIIRLERRHYTADEIFTLAKRRLPTISLATVYNNLHALEKSGLIRRIGGFDSSDRYDGVCQPHGHLFCTACLEIRDFDLPGLSADIAKLSGEKIESYELKVSYLCKKCRLALEREIGALV